MGYKFIKTRDTENPYDLSTITVEIEENELTYNEIIREFATFLHSCGFTSIKRDDIVILEDDEVVVKRGS